MHYITTLRSPVWKLFGFPVNYDIGQRQVDKTKAVYDEYSVVA